MTLRNDTLADALTRLFSSRAPKQEVLRATLGDGHGNVEYAPLANHVYIRIRSAQSQVTIAHNLKVPNINDTPVDVERDTTHNQTNYRVIGLTEGMDFAAGTQPLANLMLHGYTHDPQGYDPIVYRHVITIITGDYTATFDNDVILVDTTAAHTVFLLDATQFPVGFPITIKDAMGTGAATNNITVTPSGSQTIDGAAGVTMNTNRQVLRLVTDSHNWFVI